MNHNRLKPLHKLNYFIFHPL